MDLRIVGVEKPTSVAVASAMSCASSNLIFPEDVKNTDLALELLTSGHTTTLEHYYVTLALSGVSRHLIWSLLHAHPHYNSEQVSQRYVPMSAESVHVPYSLERHPEKRSFFVQHVERCFTDYDHLVKSLTPVMADLYYARNAQKKNDKRFARAPERLAIETARYVIPTAVTAHLYHTVNLLTLLRYRAVAADPEYGEEATLLVETAWDQLLKLDPSLRPLLNKVPIGRSRLADLDSYNPDRADNFIETFDRVLMGTRRYSHLTDWTPHSDVMIELIGGTTIAGFDKRNHPDETIAELLLSSKRQEPGVLNVDPVSKAGMLGRQVIYQFAKRISLTGDSQNQRHRATPGARPLLLNQLGTNSTYEVPGPIRRVGGAIERRYRASVEESIRAANEFARWHDENPNLALYLLPNAFQVRFNETADLTSFRHKCHMRLCLNAQEEIWDATKEEVEQVSQIHPEIGRHLAPPCVGRFQANIKPTCPEGKRFCGVQVYRKTMSEIERTY
jgi:flavin-dependent thymidylate synthase